jgi:hypothetical protein
MLLVFVAEGLVAGGEIDDGQAAVPQADGARQIVAQVVGAPVPEGGGHGRQLLPVHRGLGVKVQDSTKTTHAGHLPGSCEKSWRMIYVGLPWDSW